MESLFLFAQKQTLPQSCQSNAHFRSKKSTYQKKSAERIFNP
jgi:hypothetical protein